MRRGRQEAAMRAIRYIFAALVAWLKAELLQ